MKNEFANLRELIKYSAEKFADNIAFKIKKKDEKGKTFYDEVTYTRLSADIEHLARCLMNHHLAGERIAVIGKNSYEWVVSFVAVTACGGVIVPLDRGLLDFEIEEQLSRSQAVAIFYGEAFKERLAEKTDIIKVCMDDSEFADMLAEGAAADNKEAYENIQIDVNVMSILLFTSGTTSASKAVMLSQYNVVENVIGLRKWETLYPTDVNMALLPFHHTFGMVQTLFFLSEGMCNVFCEGLRVGKCLTEYGVSVFVGVPRVLDEMYLTISRKLEAQGMVKKVNFALKLSRVLMKIGIDVRRKLFAKIIDALGGKLRFIIVGAAPATPEVLRWFNDIGVLSVQGYGLTETSPVISAENENHMREGSVGLTLPGVEARIVNPDENGIGEIVAKGPNVMLGYYNDQAQTDEVIRDGWFYTGDLGRIDKDGYIFISGRKKNVIVLSNGKNVFPEEIEALVSQCDAIKECIVYGEGDDILLKVVRDKSFDGDCDKEIENHVKSVNEKLIYYKQIKSYVITDEEMEKTTTGKIKRYV